jgi:hypothetical protein
MGGGCVFSAKKFDGGTSFSLRETREGVFGVLRAEEREGVKRGVCGLSCNDLRMRMHISRVTRLLGSTVLI